MSSPWTGPQAPHHLVIAGLILLASVAVFTVTIRRAQSEVGGAPVLQVEPYALLEVRPSSPSATPFSVATIESIRAIDHIVAIQRYIIGNVEDANAPGVRVIGMDVTAPLRLPGARQAVAPEILKGRALGPDDIERPVAVVGRDYANIGKTIYGYQIEGMIDHTPPIRLGNTEVRVIGMFSTGDPTLDRQVLVPLTTAERLLGLASQASGLYVQVDDPDYLETVERELKAVLGQDLTINRIVPRQTSGTRAKPVLGEEPRIVSRIHIWRGHEH
jgi:ABC-type lipoprotein release transport system permease subunit